MFERYYLSPFCLNKRDAVIAKTIRKRTRAISQINAKHPPGYLYIHAVRVHSLSFQAPVVALQILNIPAGLHFVSIFCVWTRIFAVVVCTVQCGVVKVSFFNIVLKCMCLRNYMSIFVVIRKSVYTITQLLLYVRVDASAPPEPGNVHTSGSMLRHRPSLEPGTVHTSGLVLMHRPSPEPGTVHTSGLVLMHRPSPEPGTACAYVRVDANASHGTRNYIHSSGSMLMHRPSPEQD